MTAVTLINPFAVKAEDEEKFMQLWNRVDDYMKKQDGFISTKLHKNIENLSHLPPATFRFINVAVWKSAEAFQNAVRTNQFKECAQEIFPYSGGAGLYEVIISESD